MRYVLGLVRASSADAPISAHKKAFPLKVTATELTSMITQFSQSSREAHLRAYLSPCCLAVGCEQRRKMSSVIHRRAIFKRDEHSLSRHDRHDHAGPSCGSAASSACPQYHHLHLWRCFVRTRLALVASCYQLGNAASDASKAGSESPCDGP